MNETKLCPKCQEVKPLCEFYTIKAGKNTGQPSSYCKVCYKIYSQTYNIVNSEQIRLNQVKRYYGISKEEYELLPQECAICGSITNLEIDHNHATGKYRDVLCGHCNKGLGHFYDDPNLLIRATDYILKHFDQGQTLER